MSQWQPMEARNLIFGKCTQTISEEVNQSSNCALCCECPVLSCASASVSYSDVDMTHNWQFALTLCTSITMETKMVSPVVSSLPYPRIYEFFCVNLLIFIESFVSSALQHFQPMMINVLNSQLEALRRNWKFFDRFSFPFFTLQLMTELKTGLMKFHYYSNVCTRNGKR